MIETKDLINANLISVGTSLYMLGLNPPSLIEEIREEDGSWIANEYGDLGLLPLDEIAEYWVDFEYEYDGKKDKLTVQDVHSYWEQKLRETGGGV